MAHCYRHPDRETGLSCSVCERPVCTDCATFAPVGIRCPDHAGGPKQATAARARRTLGRGRGWAGTPGLVTRVLIGLNVLVFVVNLAQGASLSSNGGDLFVDWMLVGVALLDDQWWRLLTATFLHANLLHLGMNMLMLWWIGTPLEEWLGRGRYVAVYVLSGLAGSAGALLLTDPLVPTVGASGAIFGLLGAALVLESQRAYVLGGSALSIIVLNLILTFALANVSIGGHLGGLAGGAGVAFALSGFGRGTAAYRRLGVAEIAGVAGVGVLSLALAYWRVRGYV